MMIMIRTLASADAAATSVQSGAIQPIHQRGQNPGHDQRRDERPFEDEPLLLPMRAAALPRQQVNRCLSSSLLCLRCRER